MARSTGCRLRARSPKSGRRRRGGRGGVGRVYPAKAWNPGRRVAIRVLGPELAAALGPERFLREIETAARLNHPHILPLHDSGEADGFLYYVMPYVEGESVRDRLNRDRKSTRLNSSHLVISYAVFCLKKKRVHR